MQALVSMLGVALACLGGQSGQTAKPPPELPVVTLDAPGGAAVLSQTPARVGPMPYLPVAEPDGGGPQLDATRGLSLSFGRPLPVRNVLMLLFRGTPFSIALGHGVSGTFVGELKDLTLRQALETVLFPLGLDYDVDGTVVRVSRRAPQTRFFSVDHLNSSRTGSDFFGELGAGIQSLLSPAGKSHVNRRAAVVQVTDFADRLDLVAAYLETTRLRATRQVRVQARVFEVARQDGLPVDWPALGARPRSGMRPAPAGAAGWRIDDFDAWLRTIGEMGAVRHIAAPAVLALNNEPAILRAEDAAAETELRLAVTSQIAADRVIEMHVSPSYVHGRQAAGPARPGTQFTASVDTVMRIADGDTVLLGGLLRRTSEGALMEFVVLLTASIAVPAQPPTVAETGRWD